MKVLVACEFSGTVRDAFIEAGHDAVSCDLLPTESPGPHIEGDVLDVLDSGWEMMIAHPPCTYLTNSGVRWLHERPERWAKLDAASRFFRALLGAPVPMIAVENPLPHKYAVERIGRSYDQKIQPYEFGHPESKLTCFWLKGLPPLLPTDLLVRPSNGHWNNQTPSGQNRLAPGPDRWKERSRFYEGVATAMASQWGSMAAATASEPDR